MSTDALDLVDNRRLSRADHLAIPADDRGCHPPAELPPDDSPRVLLIAENASFRFGGEAILPLHYFRGLRERGIAVWMITNARNREELAGRLDPDDLSHIHFIPDSRAHRLFARLSRLLPQSMASFTVGQSIEIFDQFKARAVARTLIARHGITLVHQPMPVSPKHVSAIGNLGVPVVIGPMNGGITYPPGFRSREHGFDRLFVPLGRMLAGFANRLVPGKLRAGTLLVANPRTARALPHGHRGRVEQLAENGVDLAVYRQQAPRPSRAASEPVRFAFAGRMVHWKAIDLLLRAAARVRENSSVELHIIGDGPRRPRLRRLAVRLGLGTSVIFHGWLSHADCAQRLRACDVFVLPSLRECGGAAVLEAMAMGLPVIASNWGGPADYLDPSCGILVNPRGEYQFVAEIAAAMTRLAGDAALRQAMGEAGYQKVLREYDWRRKIDRILQIYQETIAAAQIPSKMLSTG